jgi:hypothetical protein
LFAGFASGPGFAEGVVEVAGGAFSVDAGEDVGDGGVGFPVDVHSGGGFFE